MVVVDANSKRAGRMAMQTNRSLKISLLVYFVAGVMLAACVQTPAVSPPLSPSGQAATTASIDNVPALETAQPAHIAEEPALPSPIQTPSVTEWQVFTHISGVSFQFPGDWQLIDLWDDGTGGKIKSVYSVQPPPDGYINHIGIIIESLPREQAPTLFYRAGDVIAPEYFLGPILVVWDKDVVINGNEWHLHMQGQVYDRRHDGLEYLREKGAITAGSIVALHYVEEREFYISVSQELNREMLIALDAQDGDVVLSDYLQTFNEILASVTISP